MSKGNRDIYFGSDEADILVAHLQKRSQAWFQSLTTSMYLDKLKRSWSSYHGIYYEDSHAISFGGESGELVNLPVNHFRNIAQNMLTMVTATRPSFQARAINTDLKSQIQTNLANGLLEYYMREKRLESDLRKAVEYAIVMGSGYIKMEWNATSGEIYDTVPAEYDVDENGVELIDEETGELKVLREEFPIYQGDVEFSVLSPFDVVFDTTKENGKHDWQLCRTFKNKYDIAAKYPEFRDQIVGLQTKSDIAKYRISLTPYDETVDVPVYEFFHRPTESLPKGRYVLYLDTDLVLIDTVLPYKRLPIFRIAPSDILGTPYGYTSMFDLLPLQESVNSLYSTIMTNNHTFGVQNIVAERDAGVTFSELVGGLHLVEINPGSQPPQPLNLTKTSNETYQFLQMMERSMEVVSGINSVARGNPDPKQNLRSGNALALVQSQALQFISGLQQSYIHLIEDVGTNLVQLLIDFASVPRIAQIAGKSNTTYMKEFTGDDLSSITRVIVDPGNALSQTTAGRVEMASQMMQMGAIKTPEEYISVINTGKLETMTESQNKQLLLIRAENERMTDASAEVMAVLTDDHSLHIREHQAVLADPDLRMDPALVKRALDHIQEHITILSDPSVANILMTLGQQPIQPPMPPAPPAGAPPGEQPAPALTQDQAAAGEQTGELLSNPGAQSMAIQDQLTAQGQTIAPAQPAQSPDGAPSTAAEQFARLTGV
jgi:hypothetical protein